METTSFTIKKLQKISTEARVADRLREAIIYGDIPLGTRLTEILVAQQVGVSRGTIRTAFHQLAQEGLLVQIPYTGWVVMTLSAHDAWELYTLRATLEALGSRLVARHLRNGSDSEDIEQAVTSALTKLQIACSEKNRKLIVEEDLSLHRMIMSLARHRRLLDQYTRMEPHIQIYIQSSDALIHDPDEIFAQHEPIIAAILQGDEDEAAHAAAMHNEHEGAILVEYLENLQVNKN